MSEKNKQLQQAYEIREQRLMTLMKKEAELRKQQVENRTLQKEIKRIVESRTWKYGAPIRHMIVFTHFIKDLLKGIIHIPRTRRLLHHNQRLQEDYAKLEKELRKTEQRLRAEQQARQALTLKCAESDRDRLRQIAKEAQEHGELPDYLDRLIRQKTNYDGEFRQIMTYIGRMVKNERADLRHLVYTKVLTGLKIEEVPEFILRDAGESETLPLAELSSFSANLTLRLRQRQLGALLPEWVLDNKLVAYRFVDALKIRRPWLSDQRYTLEEIPIKPGTVIKPYNGAGSRGVYLILSSKKIRDVKRSQFLDDEKVLKDNMQKDLLLGWVDQDEWLIEELVMEDEQQDLPARDLKFYCFYGKVGLILEIRRFPELRYCWWAPNGEIVRTGKYEDSLFAGEGASPKDIALAASLSSNIPAPFIRIDFLKTHKGLVFGEFTPKPGNYDQFNQAIDRKLGDYFLDAEHRLVDDLLNGKQFEPFQSLLKSLF